MTASKQIKAKSKEIKANKTMSMQWSRKSNGILEQQFSA